MDTQAPVSRSGFPVTGEGARSRRRAPRWLAPRWLAPRWLAPRWLAPRWLAPRWRAPAAWIAGSLALAAVFLRISLTARVDSDGANNALQAWDLLHGHLLLHGWEIGDANFYFFELPLNAITAAVFGLGNFAAHAASALTFAFVTVCAVALAVTGSRGPARVVRGAVVIMVLAAPLLTASSVTIVLEEPNHIGTSVFILGSFLLINLMVRPRWGSGESSPPDLAASARRFTAPLLCAILIAGQFSDLTVRYVAVPAIVAVCGLRALAARRLRSPDAALVAAAVISVPLATAMSAAMTYLGGFSAIAPRAHLAPARLWAHQANITWANLRLLFGAIHAPDTRLGALGFGFATACLLASAGALAWVAWRWRRASRAEQMLGVAIVVNIVADLISTLAYVNNPHEIAAVLPCGAVLAARAFVPKRITNAAVAFAAIAVTGLAALLPLAFAATQPLNQPEMAPLAAWLEAHGLTYGLAGYRDASSTTLLSGDRVQIRTFNLGKRVRVSNYEVNSSWYDPSLHDATFVVADPQQNYPVARIEHAFGKPAQAHRVANFTILVYRTNLLPILLRGGVTPAHPAAR